MTNIRFGLVGIFLAVCIIAGSCVSNFCMDKRPTIAVWEINTAPAIFFTIHPEIMLPLESKIFELYRTAGSKKWTTRYRYAYVFLKHNKWFSRVAYLKTHPADAVDREVIFSNQLPDPTLFLLQSTPTTAAQK